MASSMGGVHGRNNEKGTPGLPNTARNTRFSSQGYTSISGLPRSEMTGARYDSGSDDDEVDNVEEVLEDLLNPVSKQLEFASRLGQELVAQRAKLEGLQKQWRHAKEEGDIEIIRSVEREIKGCREEYAGKTLSRLSQIADSAQGNVPKFATIPATPSRRRKGEDDPFTDTRISARRSRVSQTPTSARYLSYPHGSGSDVENQDMESVDPADGMGFLVAGHMTTELRRLNVIMAEKDLALKEAQEKIRTLKDEEDTVRKRLEISNGQQERTQERMWELEVAEQALRSEINTAQTALKKSENELKKASKERDSARSEAENFKAETDRLTSDVQSLKQHYETEIAKFKGKAGALERDRSDLQQQLQKAKTRRSLGSGLLASGGRSPMHSPSPSLLTPEDARKRRRGDVDDDEDVFGARDTAKKRGPGLDGNGDPFNPDDIYGSDFDDSPYGNEKRDRSPLAPLPDVNTIEDFQTRVEELEEELRRVKDLAARQERGQSPSADSSFDSPIYNRRGGAVRGGQRVVSRGIRGVRAGRGGRRGSALARYSIDSDGTSTYSPGSNGPSPLGSGGLRSAFNNAETPARPSSRLAQSLGDYPDFDSPERTPDFKMDLSDADQNLSGDDSMLQASDSFEMPKGTLGDELADLEDSIAAEPDLKDLAPVRADIGIMSHDGQVRAISLLEYITSAEDEQTLNVPIIDQTYYVTPTNSAFTIRPYASSANTVADTPRALRTSGFGRIRRSNSDATIGPADTETEGEGTDTEYEDARSVVTMTDTRSRGPISTDNEDTDWHTAAAESSADDDSDQESVKASHNSRYVNQSTPRHKTRVLRPEPEVREVVREIETVRIEYVPQPYEVTVVQHVPIPYEVIKEVEIIREIPTPYEVIKEISVPFEVIKEVPYEVIKEVEVIREVQVESVRELPVPVPYEVVRLVETIREVPTPYEVVRELEVVREIPVPFEVIKQVEVLREIPAPFEVVREIEIIREIPTPFEVVREVERVREVEVIREIPAPFEVIREVEVIKEVPMPFEVIREVERVVTVEVPVEVLRDVHVPIPVETVRTVEKEVIKEIEILVDRIVEVEKVVEKLVIREIPVEVMVEKQVDVIREVPIEVVREIIREVPVEVIREVTKDVPFEVVREIIKEVPVEVIREVIKEVPVEVVREIVKEVPVEVTVEKHVDRETIREVPVEVLVDRFVDREVPVEKIVIQEVKVEVIREIPIPFETIREVTVEKIVEVPVEIMVDREVIVEKPFETIRHIEVIKEVPVTQEVEIVKEVFVDRPVEVIREVTVDRPVEVIREVFVDRPVEVIITKDVFLDRPVEVVKEVFIDKPVEVIREVYVDKPFEVIKEIPIDRPVETVREIPVEVRVPYETIKEVKVPFEVIKEIFVDRPFETIKEVPVEVSVPFEVIKEVPFEVIREVFVDRPVEVIKEVHVPVETVREIPVDREVIVEKEVIKEIPIEKEVIKEIVVDREVIKHIEVARARAEHKDMPVQTDYVGSMPASLSAPAPDIGLFKVTPGSNLEFLKNPPVSSSTSFGKPAIRVKQRSNSPTKPVRIAGLPRELIARDEDLHVADLSIPQSPAVSIQSYISIDRSQPPIISVPPPPTMPPPFDATRRISTPPLAPPLADFSSRAKTPMSADFNKPRAILANENGTRTNSNSMPPPAASRQPSTASLRSAKSKVPTDENRYGTRRSIEQSRDNVKRLADVVVGGRPGQLKSQTRTASYASSRSSDYGHSRAPSGMARELGMPSSSDPLLIQAITQVMIGEFMWKNTRRAMGKGMSENKHKRFFWVHPYVKTLYWSPVDPGGENTAEARSKSIYITGIKIEKAGGAADPSSWHESIIVCSQSREVKITAMSKDRHDAWLNALLFLCDRPAPSSKKDRASIVPIEALTTPLRKPSRTQLPDDFGRQKTPHSIRSLQTYATDSVTPRGQGPRSQSALSMRKRPGTPAHEYLLRLDAGLPVDGLMSMSGRRTAHANHDEDEGLRYGEGNDTVGDFGGLENMREDGVSVSGRKTNRTGRRSSGASQLTAPSYQSRHHAPRSPSAWSYRSHSRRGSERGSEISEQLFGVGDETLTPVMASKKKPGSRQTSAGSGIKMPPIPPVPQSDLREHEDAGATPSIKARKKSLIRRPSLTFIGFGSKRSKSRPNSP